MRTTFAKAALSAGVLLTLATLGPAPIRGDRLGIKPHTNLQKQDEQTLESEQHPVVMAPVGTPEAPKAEVQMDNDSGATDAAKVFKAAERGANGSGAPGAGQVIAAANARINAPPSHPWIWVLVVVGCVSSGIFGVKRWADKNVPNMPAPAPRPKRSGW